MDTPCSPSRWLLSASLAVTAIVSPLVQAGSPVADKNPALTPAVDWKQDTISPVANPMFDEDPIIRSEVRPIFAYHHIDSGFITGAGNAELYAMQIRYAITDRLAFIATEDGYFDIHLKNGTNLSGWMDTAAGLKYALIDDVADQFILTPGFTFIIPTGSKHVFQGYGNGSWNPFVSAEKGFGDFHVQTNVGFRIPDDNTQSTIFHYSLMADYKVCNWFIPFVAANGFTVVQSGKNLPINSEGYDVIDFGSSLAKGTSQMTVAGGFRSRVAQNIDLGISYEIAVLKPYGLTQNRLTCDVSYRF